MLGGIGWELSGCEVLGGNCVGGEGGSCRLVGGSHGKSMARGR